MAQHEPWTHQVSDHVMDAQVIAKRAVLEDGVVSPAEQAMLDALHAAQARITEVDQEIQRTDAAARIVADAIRYGRLTANSEARLVALANDEPTAA